MREPNFVRDLESVYSLRNWTGRRRDLGGGKRFGGETGLGGYTQRSRSVCMVEGDRGERKKKKYREKKEYNSLLTLPFDIKRAMCPGFDSPRGFQASEICPRLATLVMRWAIGRLHGQPNGDRDPESVLNFDLSLRRA